MQPPPEAFNARPLGPAELEDCRGGESEFSGPTGMDTAVILWDEVRTKQQSISSVSGQSANSNVSSTISGSLY